MACSRKVAWPTMLATLIAGGVAVELPEPVPQRKIGLPILTNDNRGHALATHRGGIEILEQSAVAVAMHVDETRREGEAV